jgi:hypothetical protein
VGLGVEEHLGEALAGSVRTLLRLLGSAQPAALARASRARQHVKTLCERMGQPSWQTEIAATLSQLGVMSLPQALVTKYFDGRTLEEDEQAIVDRIPAGSAAALTDLPRLEEVRRILEHVGDRFVADGSSEGRPEGDAIPWGARVLRVVLDFDRLVMQRAAPPDALSVLRVRRGWYDPMILSAFGRMFGELDPASQAVFLTHQDLPPRLILVEAPPAFGGDPPPPGTLRYLSLGELDVVMSGLFPDEGQPERYVRLKELGADGASGRGDAHRRRRTGVREIQLEGLEPGMVVADDVMTNDGRLLLAKGCEVTSALLRAVIGKGGADPMMQVFVVDAG